MMQKAQEHELTKTAKIDRDMQAVSYKTVCVSIFDRRSANLMHRHFMNVKVLL